MRVSSDDDPRQGPREAPEEEVELPLALSSEDRSRISSAFLLDSLDDPELQMPDDETLIAYAEGCLGSRRHGDLLRQAERFPAVALLLAEFWKEHAAIRELAAAGNGWTGPLLAAQDALPSGVSRSDWEAHLRRNSGARWKQAAAQALRALGLLPFRPVQLAFAGGGWAAALVLVGVLAVGPKQPEPAPRQPAPVSKGGDEGDVDARYLDAVFYPDPDADVETLEDRLDLLRETAARRPNAPEYRTARIRLLRQILARELDRNTQAKYQKELKGLLASPAPK